MSTISGLSQTVWSEGGDRLYSFEQAAYLIETSTVVLERYVTLGLIEPTGAMLRREELTRVKRILRLRRDLGLNITGAAMVLDMAEEISRLKAQLQAYREVD